jgi:hypothetical protein
VVEDDDAPAAGGTPRGATRFELSALQMADAWLRAGRIEVHGEELRDALEFLARVGVNVRDTEAGLLHVQHRDGHVEDMTREAVMLLAFRCLVEQIVRLRAAGRRLRRDAG